VEAIRVAIAIALLLASCGDDDDSSREAAIAVAGGPGTEIAEGFTVVEGSRLVGPAFPAGATHSLNGVPQVDQGFVTGDADQVVAAYRDALLESLGEEGLYEGDPLPGAGGTLRTFGASQAGGASHEVTWFASQEHGDWLWIRANYD
jgi:hypothetical protein